MDIHSNLEYLCRVCAANTKGRNSVAECVYIFKTDGLKDKLDTFLYLKISENDSLPKVLCKSCFRQVEATASLSKIAKHTQQVFRDFLSSNLPKGPSESTNTSEFTSSDFMGNKKDNEKSKNDEMMVVASPAPVRPPPPPPLVPTLTTASRKDEVVVNVSVADPLTRDNQQKMISNSQRRQSLLIEPRFSSKSIVQKAAAIAATAAPRLIVPKSTSSLQHLDAANTTNNFKIPASSYNFYPPKTQPLPTPQSAQITTFSSGGYVIGRINTDGQNDKTVTLPLTATADNILQQKRKNLVKALINLKANNSRQVSLLKSSQQKQAEAMQNIAKPPSTEVVNQTPDDELPEKIIIAAPKNRYSTKKSKKEPLNLSSKAPVSIAPLSDVALSAATAPVVQQKQDQSNSVNVTPQKSAFPDDILLGRVIRDMDLLKLILKALKWPVNKRNMEIQLQRLKESKFTDIISDVNLLQDTDLTQLLSPYLAPVLLAVQALQQQQQQILKNTNSNHHVTTVPLKTQPKMTDLEAAQAEINKSIPYKLPPETSVQLVPATPEETEPTPSPPLSTKNTPTETSADLKAERLKEIKTAEAPQKRQRRSAAQKARDSILISDEEDTQGVPRKRSKRSTKSAPNIHIELNPNFLSQFNLLNGSGGNESEELMSLLMKQKSAVMKDNKMQQRLRRNSVASLVALPPSEFDSLIDLDDEIVLMEPVTTTSSSEGSSVKQELQQQQLKTDFTNTFAIPSVPVITRPIIKRRKTVIYPPKNVCNLSIELNNKEHPPPASNSSPLIVQSKDKLMDETINQVAMGNATSLQDNNTDAMITSAELTITKAPQQRKTQNKSALGQQLLEAIGLKKIPPTKSMSTPQTEAASSPLMANAMAVLPNSKQSIQQIRSALKNSLKQAQEQQQQKKKELSFSVGNTIIQDADSTTKPAIKEIVVVEGKGNKTETCSSMVDVEDQIDKVTLMVRKNDEENAEQSKLMDEKKEVKKLSNIKIQGRRRTLLAAGTRVVAANSIERKDKSNEEEQQQKIMENDEMADDNEKMEKDNSANITSSSGATGNEGSTPTTTEAVLPKKRGRKRLVDKIVLEAPEENEKDVDNTEEESEDISQNKNEEETEGNKISGRPARQSKTQSKYYKGPDKVFQGRRFLPSRSTRNRKYC